MPEQEQIRCQREQVLLDQRLPDLDDDALARKAAVEPKDVDLICRYLEILGKLHRRLGPKGKIISFLINK
jgi:hypothetical protein